MCLWTLFWRFLQDFSGLELGKLYMFKTNFFCDLSRLIEVIVMWPSVLTSFFFFGLCGNLKLFKGIVHLSFTLIYSPSCHSMRYKLLSFCVFGVFFPLGAWQLWTLWTVIICQEPCAFMHRKNNSLWVWIDTRASKWCADISKKQYRQKILLNIFASICYFFFIYYVDDVPTISKTIMVIAMKQIVFKSITVAVIMQNTSTQTSISH